MTTHSSRLNDAGSVWRAHFHDHLKSMGATMEGLMDFEHCPDDMAEDCVELITVVIKLIDKYEEHSWEEHYGEVPEPNREHSE